MYSRYKVRFPSPPPDYAGTAIPSDGALPSGTQMPAGRMGDSTHNTVGNSMVEGTFQPTVGLQDTTPCAELPDSNREACPTDRSILPVVANTPPGESYFDRSEPLEEAACPDGPAGGDHSQTDRDESMPDSSKSPAFCERIPMEENEKDLPKTAFPQKGFPSDPFALLDGLTLDDLLFIGAMLFLMSGKAEDDSILLFSYLLTCGL